jgi:regulator of replication initiation timing
MQDLMKTARYQKRCFDQIEEITTANKELTAEVERLRHQLETANQERTNREAQNQDLVGQLQRKEQEKTGKFSPYHNKCRTCVNLFFAVIAVMQV